MIGSILGLSGAEPARLGYRYEDWVIIRYFADVIAGTATIQFEGDIPLWTEARIVRSDGSREVVQCKSRSKGRWTVNRLASDSVLDGLIAAASRGERFRFVSNQPCVLADAANHASRDDDDDVWLGEAEVRGYLGWIQELAERVDRDLPQTRRLLRAAVFESKDAGAAEELSRLAISSFVRVGFRNNVINALITGLSDREAFLGRKVTYDVLNDHLASEEIRDWRSATRENVGHRLRTLTSLFVAERSQDSLPRPEARKVSDLVLGGDGFVKVRGLGGYGKSVLLAEAVSLLEAEDYGVAAIDARLLPDGLAAMGGYLEEVGLPDGLVEGLSLYERSVLVLDQLDSVSPALGGSAGRWAVVERLVADALGGGVQVVVGCRPVNGLSLLVPEGCREGEVLLGEWSADDMARLTGTAGPLPEGIPRVPVFGVLWRELAEAGDLPLTVGALLTMNQQDARRRAGLRAAEMIAVEDILTAELEKSGNAPCPRSRLAAHSEAVEGLISGGYLERSGHGVVFRHDVVGEHAWASAFDRRGGDIEALLANPGLHVHRRLRDILQFLANEGAERRTELVRSLRTAVGTDIRPSLAASAIFWMADCDRESARSAWPVLRDALGADTPWRRDLALRVLRDNDGFFGFAYDEGVLAALAVDDAGVDTVIRVAAATDPAHDPQIAALAVAVLGDEVPWSKRAAPRWMHLAVLHPMPDLIDAWTRSINVADEPDSLLPASHLLDELAARSPASAAGVLAAWLSRHQVLATDAGYNGAFDPLYNSLLRQVAGGRVAPERLASSHPEEYIKECGKVVLDCCRVLPNGLASVVHLGLGFNVTQDQPGISSLAAMFIQSLGQALSKSGTAAHSFVATSCSVPGDPAIALCAIAHTRAAEPDSAIEWLDRLANADVALSFWSRDAILMLLDRLEETTPGLIDTIEGQLADWATREMLVEESPESSGRAISRRVSIAAVDEQPTEDDPKSVTEVWDDTQWRAALTTSEHAESRASELEERASSDPERFIRLLIETPRPIQEAYLRAILRGAARAKCPAKVDIRALEEAVDRLAPAGDNTAHVVALLCRSIERSPTPAERDAAIRYAETPSQASPSWVTGSSKDWIPADLEWRHQQHCLAAAALGRWVNEYPDDMNLLDPLVGRAIATDDLALSVALVDGLQWAGSRSPRLADERVLRLLVAFPVVGESLAINAYTQEAWRRGRPSLPDHWTAIAFVGPGSHLAGVRWTVNQIKIGQPPTVEAVRRLPAGSQAGVAQATADLAQVVEQHTWCIPILAFLLESPEEAVHAEARRWEYTATRPQDPSDALNRRAIPARLLVLVPPTVRRMDKLMNARELLLALAATGSASQAREACRLTQALLPAALPVTDLAYGYDLERSIPIATAAHETLRAEGADTTPALDLLDSLVQKNPGALVRNLATLR